MRIREATRGDQERLLDIWLQSVRATHGFLSQDDIQSLLPLVRDHALKQLELWVLVAEDSCESMVIGFMGLVDYKLEAIFLAPEYLRQGGGRLLVEHAQRLKGPLWVDVNLSWKVDPMWTVRAGRFHCCTCVRLSREMPGKHRRHRTFRCRWSCYPLTVTSPSRPQSVRNMKFRYRHRADLRAAGGIVRTQAANGVRVPAAAGRTIGAASRLREESIECLKTRA